MSDTITLVSNELGDWKALYINNDRVYQGHSIDAHDALTKVMGYTVHEFFSIEYEMEPHQTEFPQTLSELKTGLVGDTNE